MIEADDLRYKAEIALVELLEAIDEMKTDYRLKWNELIEIESNVKMAIDFNHILSRHSENKAIDGEYFLTYVERIRAKLNLDL